MFDYLQHVEKGCHVNYFMITINELRICKSCGNVFSKKAGVTIITECPQCKGTSFEQIVSSNSENEETYLDELD